jgi:acetolactate synthase I/II/III large subunit
MKRTGAQIVWECLVQEGVEFVFGYPGGANLPIYDAMLDYPIRHILGRHEQSLVHMADGYARASGKVGVAMATSGPGATNLVTGIANAHMDSIPLVCITGQVPTSLIGYDAFQETDITGITLPITKHNYLVTRVDDIMPAIREAFYIAKSGRPGPVLVDIAKDAQQAVLENWEYDHRPIRLPGYRPDLRPADKTIQTAAEMINAAKRPLILAGHGILMSNAMDEVRRFAETAHVPVAMTLLGFGVLPSDHPLNLGMMGMHGEAWVNAAIQQADLLLAFGMRFDDRVTGKLRTYATQAKKIHIDVDPSEIDKNVKVDLGLVGDLKDILRAIIPLAEETDRSAWIDFIKSMRSESKLRDIQNLPEGDRLFAAHVIHDLWRCTRGTTTVVTDVGQHQMWAAQYYRIDSPHTWITSGGLGTMGFGLPAAIGAKLATPERDVWVIVGDGGFQMTMSELATAAQEGIKVNVAVINNGYLGMVRQWQEFFYEKRYAATPLHNPDFVKIAEAHGLTGICVTRRSEVDSAIAQAVKTEGTVVVEFKVQREDVVYPMVPAGADLQAMIRRPSVVPEVNQEYWEE